MRFVHTADWQIGMKATHVGKAGVKVREERLNAATRVIDAAKSHRADFILLAGDTFEDNGIDRVLVQKTADILAAFGGPVYIIPGNHDPLVPGSVWEHPAWSDEDNLNVLKEESPVEIQGGILYPCPAHEKKSGKDPTAWIKDLEGEGIRIGLAHGTVEGIHREEPEYPVPRDAAVLAGLDYLALGHWHSTAVYPDPNGTIRMAYSGTHEPTRFGERDSGNILVVGIEDPGKSPEVTSIKTGGLEWLTIADEIRQAGDMGRIRERIEKVMNPSATLVDIRLSGLLDGSDRQELERLNDIIASRFLFERFDISKIRPMPEDENWLAGLPPGVVREAALRLQSLCDPAFPGDRPDGASPEVASRALMELYALIQEVHG
jgi:DNA repair exonuclease SbcCD nuclease subunit